MNNPSNPLRVLEYIEETLCGHGYQPSYTQIAEHFKWKSRTQVYHCVRWLEAGGYIAEANSKANRCLAILKWADGSPFTGLVR